MTTIQTEGVFHMPRERYDEIRDRVNFSTLKAIHRSPAHYAHNLVQPFEDTDPKKLGRAIHMAVLEPERYERAVAVWDGGTRRGKDWDRFKEENVGRELLTEREAEQCEAVQKAVRADPLALRYLSDGVAEATMLWSLDGVRCKGRLDYDAPTAIVDLKTTRDASPDGFGKEVWRYRYHTQAAWYLDGYVAAGGPVKPYILISVESEAPHVVQVYRLPQVALDLGREEYREWMKRLAECRLSGKWPGYFDGEGEVQLPRWAVDFALEDDIRALDLEIPSN